MKPYRWYILRNSQKEIVEKDYFAVACEGNKSYFLE